MQTHDDIGEIVLIVAAIFVVVLLVLLSIRGFIFKKRLLKNRSPMKVEDIQKQYFPNVDLTIFVPIWKSLSDTLKIDATLLRPDDSLDYYANSYAYNDIMWDDIESWLRQQNENINSVEHMKCVSDLIIFAINYRL